MVGRGDDQAVARGASEETGIVRRPGIAGRVLLKAFASMLFSIEVAVA
jgi:hypothetical protein